MEENTNKNSTISLCEQELAQVKERYYYLQADFDNFRRNAHKEREQWTFNARITLLRDILPIIDNFERAFAEIQRNDVLFHQHMVGFELIYKSLLKILEKNGVESIQDTSTFDPEFHEALVHVPASEQVASGSIVEVFQKGYYLRLPGGKVQVIRPAHVSVAQ